MDGGQKGLSIFIIFKYVNNHDVLFQKMFSKVVNHFFFTLKIWDEVGDGGDQFSKSPYVREFSDFRFQTSSHTPRFLKTSNQPQQNLAKTAGAH